MRLNKKASLEIGINTIVILVIAMVLLGLGIGFIRGLFKQSGELPGLIDTDQFNTPPDSQTPIRITPSSVALKGGDSKPVKVGVYNKDVPGLVDFTVAIPRCKGKGDVVIMPVLLADAAKISQGESQGFRVIVTAEIAKVINAGSSSAAVGDKMDPGEYICKLVGIQADAAGLPLTGSNVKSYDTQFIMTVTT